MYIEREALKNSKDYYILAHCKNYKLKPREDLGGLETSIPYDLTEDYYLLQDKKECAFYIYIMCPGELAINSELIPLNSKEVRDYLQGVLNEDWPSKNMTAYKKLFG